MYPRIPRNNSYSYLLVLEIISIYVDKIYPRIASNNCNEHGTIYAISSDFGDRMTTQSMELMVLLSEHF